MHNTIHSRGLRAAMSAVLSLRTAAHRAREAARP